MTSTETGFSGSLAPNASRANQMASIATAAPSSSNTLVAKYIYDAWGNEATTSFDNLTVKNPLRYRGAEGYLHLYGPDACRGWSLYLAGARVYHTGVGRWLTEDPLLGNLGDPMSFNRYLYVNANPVDYSDPSGLFQFSRRRCKAPTWYSYTFGGMYVAAFGSAAIITSETPPLAIGVGVGGWIFMDQWATPDSRGMRGADYDYTVWCRLKDDVGSLARSAWDGIKSIGRSIVEAYEGGKPYVF